MYTLTTCVLQTGGQFLEEEKQFLGVQPLNLTLLEYSQYCYDATWTLAYALNKTLNGEFFYTTKITVSYINFVATCSYKCTVFFIVFFLYTHAL